MGNAIYRNYSEQGNPIGTLNAEPLASQHDGGSLLLDAIDGNMFENIGAEDSSMVSKLGADAHQESADAINSKLVSKSNKLSGDESSETELAPKGQTNKQSGNNSAKRRSDSGEEE